MVRIPLQTSLGAGITLTRAVIGVSIDFEGLIVPALANELRVRGGHRVENILLATEDNTNVAFTAAGGATASSATQVTFDGTANANISQTATILDDASGAGNRTFVLSVDVALVSGTLSAAADVTLRIAGNAITAASREIGLTITGTSQRFELTALTDAAGTTVIPSVECDVSAVLTITRWQLEEVSGQTDKRPGEYVSVGVLTAPFHGAGVASVQWFDTLPANTVSASGIVTETTGPTISLATASFMEWYDLVSGTVAAIMTDSSSLTSDLTVIAYLNLADWTPSVYGTILGKFEDNNFTANKLSFRFGIESGGELKFQTSPDGTAVAIVSSTSSVATGIDASVGRWVRASFNNTSNTVNFFTSDQSFATPYASLNWTQLGTADVAHATTGVYDGGAGPLVPVTVGYDRQAAVIEDHLLSAGTAGRCYRAAVFAATNATGTPVLNFNPGQWENSLTWWDDYSNLWRASGQSLYGPKRLYAYFGQSITIGPDPPPDIYISTPDSAAASQTGSLCLIAHVNLVFGPSYESPFVSKWSRANQKSYWFGYSAGYLTFVTSIDGAAEVTSESSVAGPFTATDYAGGYWIMVVFDDTSDTATYYTSTDSPLVDPNKVSWTQLGTPVAHVTSGIYDGTALLIVGHNVSGEGSSIFSVQRAVLISGTDYTAAPAVDFNPVEYDRSGLSGTVTWTASTGEAWTVSTHAALVGYSNPVSDWDAKGPLGAWIEGARTNQVNHNDVSWNAPVGCTETWNGGRSPNGLYEAVLIIGTGGGAGNLYSRKVHNLGATGTYCVSAYVKAVSGASWAMLHALTFTNQAVMYYSIRSPIGVGASSTGAATQGVIPYPNGWVRIWFSWDPGADVNGEIRIRMAGGDGSSSVTRTSASQMLWWGLQVELGTFPSSPYIDWALTGTPVAKAADNLVLPASGYILDDAGIISAEVQTDWKTAAANACVIGRNIVNLYSASGDAATLITANDGTNTSVSPARDSMFYASHQVKMKWGAALTAYKDGKPDPSPASYDGALGTGDIGLGSTNAGASHLFGTMRNVKLSAV
jgi:hypothetical protein